MKLFYTLLPILLLSIGVSAQKLPDVQVKGILAPNTIRIDGKNLEWESFAAENKRTNLWYTIANDDKNLYLAIKAIDNEAITKIMAGGISFTINTKGKKREQDALAITYPLIARTNGNRGNMGQNRQRAGQERQEQSQKERDSINLAQRKIQLAGVKEIKVLGFKQFADTLISIYNEHGIKAVAKMDEQGAYVYEAAIPLSLLEIVAANANEIAYQIKLNGLPNTGNFAMRANAAPAFGGGNARGGNFGGGGNANAARQDLMTATDFWGKYILQK